MSRVSTYLNFRGEAEQALQHYAGVFGSALEGPLVRMGHMPADPAAPALSESDRNLVAHAVLPILAGHVIMASDVLESAGMELRIGNNVTINLETDTDAEADELYTALSDGGSESTGMQHMPWGYWGCTLDRFGIRWMFNCTAVPV